MKCELFLYSSHIISKLENRQMGITNKDGLVAGLLALEAKMPVFPSVLESTLHGDKVEDIRLLDIAAQRFTKTARPISKTWDGRSNIGANQIAKRNNSDSATHVFKGPETVDKLREEDPGSVGYVIQDFNQNFAAYGEMRVLFLNREPYYFWTKSDVNKRGCVAYSTAGYLPPLRVLQ